MIANVGGWDRVIRIVIAIVAAYVGAAVGGAWGVVLYVVAAIALVTGVIGLCPLYTLFRRSTRQVPQR